ncbi:MAG: PilN domain-containing protein [Burkholderiaceae bacterium]|nr:PilN domain-containing protein [Burkholderiaceae bacterium]
MAAQQLNLLDARFLPQRLPFSAVQGLAVVAAVLLASTAAAQWLQLDSARQRAASRSLQDGLAPLRQQLVAAGSQAGAAAPGRPGAALRPAEAELQQLRLQDGAQRRIREALEAGVAGQREGPSEHLLALARQANGAVWITGFSLSEDGRAIDLEGRMLDAAALPDYLRRLNAEPRFKGRPFAQLSLKAADAPAGGSAPAATDFSLRSLAANLPATTPGGGSAP